MFSRWFVGALALAVPFLVLSPSVADAAPKVSYQKSFSNATITAAKKYGGGISTNACLNTVANSLAKTYARGKKTTTAQRRAAITKAQNTCGAVEVGLQLSKQKTAKKVVSKSSSANKKRLKKRSHIWVGARAYKRGKTRYTVLITAAPRPVVNSSMSNDVLMRVHDFNMGGSTTDTCLQTQANMWTGRFATKGTSSAAERTKVMKDAAAVCSLDNVRLYQSTQTTASKVANHVKATSNTTWTDTAYTRVGVRTWSKGSERYTAVLVGKSKNVADPTRTTNTPEAVDSTSYCDFVSHSPTYSSPHWICHSFPSAGVMQRALIDSANRARAKQSAVDGITRATLPYKAACWDDFQQDFANYKRDTNGTNMAAYSVLPHSTWFISKGRTYYEASISCRINSLFEGQGGEIVTAGNMQPTDFAQSGIQVDKLADRFINNYMNSPPHRGILLWPGGEKSFFVGVGWSCTDMPENFAPHSYSGPLPVCNVVLDPTMYGPKI